MKWVSVSETVREGLVMAPTPSLTVSPIGAFEVMHNYTPKSSLTWLLAASFIFTVFGLGAAASIRPAEIARQQTIPCVFDNFIWFKDQEIVDEIRKDVPSFDGAAPEAGDSINKILGALERMLKKKGLPSQVEYVFFSGAGYQYRPEHVFTA